MNNMLSEALRQFVGLLEQLIRNLLGKDAETWGNELKKFLRKEPCWVIELKSMILKIDRSKAFDPVKFIGAGWKIEEQDEHSLAITELDLSQVKFVDMLNPGETVVNGEEKQKRLAKAGHIRLDAKIFQTLWENKALIPESWKKDANGNIRYVYFDGTILRFPDGSRSVLCLYWRDGGWSWGYDWLGRDWRASRPSAVLASSTKS